MVVDIGLHREAPPIATGTIKAAHRSWLLDHHDARTVPRYKTYSLELKGTITVSLDRIFTPQTYWPQTTRNRPFEFCYASSLAVSLVIGLSLDRIDRFFADRFLPEARELRRVAI